MINHSRERCVCTTRTFHATSSILDDLIVAIFEFHLLTSSRITTLFIELDVLIATVQDQFPDTEGFGRRIEGLDDGQA